MRAQSKEKLKAERRKGYMKFGYEDLEVWKKAVDFAVEVIERLEEYLQIVSTIVY